MSTSVALLRPCGSGATMSVAAKAVPSNHPALDAPVLLCNLCWKQLVTTCFLCICDCIFCEECTYRHFETSSNCPTCNKLLNETDFREVNIVNGSKTQAAENALTSYQALFAKLGSTSNSKALPLSDLCYSAIKQMDSGKNSVRFVLKQLLLETTNVNQRHGALQRSYDDLKNNLTKLQQQYSAERLQLQQVNTDLQQRLQARERANKDLTDKVREQERIIDQFQKYHNKRTALSEDYTGSIQPSSASSTSYRSQNVVQPPLQRFIIRQETQKQLKQQSYAASRQPNVFVSSRINSSATSLHHPPTHPFSKQIISEGGSQTTRPFSNHIRDLTASTAFSFSERKVNRQNLAKQSSANVVEGSGDRHLVLNKRRRVEAAQFFVGASPIVNMSPTTAFTLNQGPYNAPLGPGDSAQWCNGQTRNRSSPAAFIQ